MSDLIHDPLQKVNVLFLELPGGRLELVEPSGEGSPVSAVLVKNTAVHHHICFEVKSLDEKLAECRKAKMIVVSSPKPAVAFSGRRIAFVLGPDMLLWELLEAAK